MKKIRKDAKTKGRIIDLEEPLTLTLPCSMLENNKDPKIKGRVIDLEEPLELILENKKRKKNKDRIINLEEPLILSCSMIEKKKQTKIKGRIIDLDEPLTLKLPCSMLDNNNKDNLNLPSCSHAVEVISNNINNREVKTGKCGSDDIFIGIDKNKKENSKIRTKNISKVGGRIVELEEPLTLTLPCSMLDYNKDNLNLPSCSHAVEVISNNNTNNREVKTGKCGSDEIFIAIDKNKKENSKIRTKNISKVGGRIVELEEPLTSILPSSILEKSETTFDMSLNIMPLISIKEKSRVIHKVEFNSCAEHYIGEINVLCIHCGAKHFSQEKVSSQNSFDDCCNHGKVILERLQNFPDELKELFSGTHKFSKIFFLNIGRINMSFSFASFNANVINFHDRRPGPFCFKIQGQIYYQINTALNPESGQDPSYGQLFIYDGEEANKLRSNQCNIDPTLLGILDNLMRKHNIFAKSYMMMDEEIKMQQLQRAETNQVLPELNLTFTLKQGLDPGRYNIQKCNEVVAIFTTNSDGEIPDSHVVIRNKNTKQLRRVSSMDPNVELWTYPLFFPHGSQGWHTDLKKVNSNRRVTRLNYIRDQIAIRDNEFNAFIRGGRLFQQYLVDSYVKIERDRINWCNSHQKELRAESYQGLLDYVRSKQANLQNYHVGKIVILPSTFIGSPRNMIQKYQDSMAITRVFGKPDLFITMTCNSNWQEIKENLLPGQQASDRPDICARVFDIKKDALLDLICKKKLFGDVASFVYTIEFQKRGLPHMHLLVTLKTKDKMTTVEKVDKFISAEIPDPIDDPDLHKLVMKHMIHGPCGTSWKLYG